MLISNEEANKRLNSPMNLFNRMKSFNESKSKAMDLFGISRNSKSERVNPFANAIKTQPEQQQQNHQQQQQQKQGSTTPLTGVVVDSEPEDLAASLLDVETKTKEQLIHKTAVNILSKTMSELEAKLPELAAPRLADVAVKMSKVIDTINNSKNKDREEEKTVHLHFYTPEQRKITDYKEVTV